ncbi:MAG: type IV pili methyl-accepting chemotaxis transducer N-terminal domain-containing protein [Thiobacillus sp.]|nr:type IV pili methyl-accepting chemotaxis transducer N-terminal domain-containing protein [Thiobacillus sp.]
MFTKARQVLRLPSRKALSRSLLLRMGGAIAAIAMLALLGMSVSGLVAESTQGSGEAINRAGSLRMQAWKMAAQYVAVPPGGNGHARWQLKETIHRFDETLDDPAIRSMLPRVGESVVNHTYGQIRDEWRTSFRPRFMGVAEGAALPADGAERDRLLRDTSLFVGRINQLVKQMEDSTEAKILVMRMVLGGALLITVLVVLLTIWLIHTQLVQPLRKLLALAASVGHGDLTARTEHTGEDELGELGRAFNLMAEDLSKLYQDLESRVQQKTSELTRSNQSLELLYHSIARLHGAPPGKAVYLALLRDIEQLLGLGHGIICLGDQGGGSGVAVASTMQNGEASPCDKAECLWCHGADQTRFSIVSDFHRRLTLPLADAEKQYGVLILDIPEGRQLEAWQIQLLEALSRHIGVAIGAERRIEQNRRVALLEERAVIARELHDSLAQSLAYMRIQVSRLQLTLKDPSKRGEADQVLLELREGMSSAYRQLRELLTTFRLKMEGQDLSSALRQTVEEFIERGELAIDLTIDLDGCPLSPNEEIHVLHIVREALSNVLNHAQARHAWISLACQEEGEVQVTVKDDGVGIEKSADVHHYGMTIMEERARTLAGVIAVTPRTQGGTRVTLSFRPTSRRANNTSTTAPLRRFEA